MKKTKPLLALLLTLVLLNACSGIAEGLGASKKKGSDEFLVKKKAPLILPPSYGELPEPEKNREANTITMMENDTSIQEMIVKVL